MAIKILTLIVSIIIIISVCLQESRSDGLSGAIGGGAEQLFGKKRSRGYDSLLHKISLISIVIFFILAIVALFL